MIKDSVNVLPDKRMQSVSLLLISLTTMCYYRCTNQ